MKKSLMKKCLALVLAFTMLVGNLSTVAFAATPDVVDFATASNASNDIAVSNIGDIENVTNGKTFTLRRDYYDLLTSHPLFGTKYFIAYPWENSFFIWFFHDDLSNIKFNMWNRGSNFGLYPSKEVSFTEYVYDRNTLEFIKSWDRTIYPGNAYNYSYEFIANFDIYTDETYSKYFYETDENPPVDVTPPVKNETNGNTFTLQRDYYNLLTSHSLYGTKDYIAYPWKNDFYIWFFNDDLSDVNFSMWSRGSENFGLNPSRKVSFTEYVYNKDTLEFVKSWDRTIDTSNVYNFGYDFISSFNIYTDKTYSTYFYDVNNSVEDVQFKPLEPEEAEDFLEFIANTDWPVDVKNELPEYYNFLIGGIQNPEEELKTKISFLTFLYYCFDAQLAQIDVKLDMGTTHLINWIKGNSETSNIIYSQIEDSIVDNLRKTIGANATIPNMTINGVNIVNSIISYADIFIVALGSFESIRDRDEIHYLIAYKHLLEAKAANDPIEIMEAEAECEIIIVNLVAGADIKKVQRFAGYLYNIEQSLSV